MTRLNPKQILLLYLVSALFVAFIGYFVSFKLWYVSDYDITSAQNVGFIKIFENNILFFFLISVFPVINLVLFLFQFAGLGSNVYQIQKLSFQLQFKMLYRHTFFELIALFIAVYISYLIFYTAYDYLHDNKKKVNKKILIKKIIISYSAIVLCTVTGAILEGNMSV